MQLDRPPTELLDNASLFLDFDGTLVELASTPDSVEVEAPILILLQEIQQRMGGRVALLTGRRASDIGQLIHPVELPLAGSHGLERVVPGLDSVPVPQPEGLSEVIQALKQLEASHPGVLIEEKPAGVAIHYRLAPEAEAICRERAERAAMAIGMELQHGKKLVELKQPGFDKGSAVRHFMAEPPFAGTRPIFIGDDLTDEHGFVAVRQFDGCGILVGPERATAATYRLPDVESVRAWLETACSELA